jgi:hypothetical protein
LISAAILAEGPTSAAAPEERKLLRLQSRLLMSLYSSMKTFVVTVVMTLIASQAFAQTPDSMPPTTR